jgi:hypothetical protein
MPSAPRVSLAAAILSLWACARPPAPGPARAAASTPRPDPAVLALVGEWAGEYGDDGLGPGGSIAFSLAAYGDTARGDVVMLPRGSSRPLLPAREEGEAGRADTPDPLTISFVRVGGDHVSGSLAPYADPACGCTLYTSLVGRLAGDAISGTFSSLNAAMGTMRQTGTWKVLRRRSP